MDAPAPPQDPSGRRDFLLLAAVLAAINLPYLGNGFLPGHDAKYLFGIFSSFYNHAVVEHDLPRWMAYGTFGIKGAGLQAAFLSPCSYLGMLGGALVGARDALTVFTLSMIGEQMLFLLGIHLLSRRLFKDRLTPLIIGFAAVCGIVWYWQVSFNFRLLYLVPLEIYFLFRFSDERRPEFFWLSALTLLFGGLGCPPYFYPLQALVLLAVCLGLGRGFREAVPSLASRSWRNGAAFGLCVLTAAAIGLTLHEALDGIRLASPGRDSQTGRVTLQSFLTYGGVSGRGVLAGLLGDLPDFGHGVDRELTHFIGLLPLAGLPVALARCRSPQFRSLMIPAVLLLLFSLGGTFAAVVFRLPLMGLYRHVGAVTPLATLLLLLASGFGVDALLSSVSAGLAWDRRTRLGALGVLALALWAMLDVQLGGERIVTAMSAFSVAGFQSGAVKSALAVVLRLLAYLAAGAVVLWPSRTVALGGCCPPAAARKMLLAALVLDGLLFQALVISRMPRTTDPLPFPAGELPYHERRSDARDAATEERLRQWRSAGGDGAEYHLAICSAFRIDPATGADRQDWSSRPVWELKEARWRIHPDPLLPSILGVTAPKLRLFSSAIYADSPEAATRQVSRVDLSESQVVLEGVPPERRFTGAAGAASLGSIRVKEFSANRVVVAVDSPHDGPVWLAYADSFQSGWSATVNGAPAPIAKAFLAFKAVRLEKGGSTVVFVFHDGVHTHAARLLALLAAAFAAAGAGAFALQFRGGKGGISP